MTGFARSAGCVVVGVFTLSVPPPAAASDCRMVAGDRILASDLAVEFESFSRLPPGLEIALSPAPGVRRHFSEVEIQRLAGRHGIEPGQARPACFTRSLEPLREDQIRAALEASLEGLNARLELIDYLRAPAPAGPLEFPRTGLGRAAAGGSSLWRGLIRYGAGRTHPVWARVRVRAESPRVIALRALPAGRPIEADAVEVRLIESPVFQPPAPAAVEAVAGRIPRRTIRVGEWVDGRILAAPRDVEAGEIVEVEVRSGAARVAFQGKAESGGRAGDSILIRNRQTGRRLRAVVAGKGKVSVDEGSSMADLRSGGGRLGGQEAR